VGRLCSCWLMRTLMRTWLVRRENAPSPDMHSILTGVFSSSMTSTMLAIPPRAASLRLLT
jgi:hypothetical protein